MLCWAGQYPQRLGHAGAIGVIVPLLLHWGAPFRFSHRRALFGAPPCEGCIWRPVAANIWVCRSPSAAGGAGWGQCGSFLAPVGHGMGFGSFRSAVRLGVLALWLAPLAASSPSSRSPPPVPCFRRPAPPACLATGSSSALPVGASSPLPLPATNKQKQPMSMSTRRLRS